MQGLQQYCVKPFIKFPLIGWSRDRWVNRTIAIDFKEQTFTKRVFLVQNREFEHHHEFSIFELV